MTTGMRENFSNHVTSDVHENARVGRGARNHPHHQGKRRSWSHAWIAIMPLLLAALIGLFWSGVQLAGIAESWSRLTSLDDVRSWIQGCGSWGPAVFLLAEVIQVIVPPIPGGVFPPIAAALFGPRLAFVLAMIGTTIGSAIAFALARKWGRPLLERVVCSQTIDKYAVVFTARGGFWLFLIMAFPFLPGDAVCAAGGTSSISFRRFLILTTLGRLPSTLLGIYLITVPPEIWHAAAIGFLPFVLLGLRYRERLEAWFVQRAQ